MIVNFVQWLRGKLTVKNITEQTWLMRTWMLAAPLGYVAVESGWIVREVGRQPWIVYGQIRTADAVSNVPASNVLVSLIAYTSIYLLLFGCALYFGSRIIRQGPNLALPIPNEGLLQSRNTENITESVTINKTKPEISWKP